MIDPLESAGGQDLVDRAAEERSRRPIARGAVVGAIAGGVAALGDFGATWLWLPPGPGQLELLIRLLGVLVPLGAAAGGLGLALGGLSRAATQRLLSGRIEGTTSVERWTRRLWPLPLLVLATPFAAWVAMGLFEGGWTSTLPLRPLWIAGTTLLLGFLGYAALRATNGMVGWARHSRWRAYAGAAAALGLHLALAKVDQRVYPNLYDTLHGLLALASFAAAAVAVWILGLPGRLGAGAVRRLEAHAGWLSLALAGMLVANLASLPGAPAAHVTLLDPRAATSRSALQALAPLYRWSPDASTDTEALERARRSRERRRALLRAGDLPEWPGAHLLLVTVDALRADALGAYGYGRGISPSFDQLAEEAVLFERAYAAAPHSSYSLSSLMTGEYIHERVDLGAPLPTQTFAQTLNEQGYHSSALFTRGVFHTEGDALAPYREGAFGFARPVHEAVDAEGATDHVLHEVDRIVAAGEPPSFLWVHYFDPHEPYRETALGTSPRDRYDGEVRNVDRAFGRLLQEARSRLERELVVVVTADHGEEFRDHGGVYHGSTLYDEQVRVPLIVAAPGLAPRRVQAPVELVDVMPTALSMLGVPLPASVRGDDLRALALGRVEDAGPAFAAVGRQRMVVRWPHKLVVDLRYGTRRLFDLSADPGERHNLAGDATDTVATLGGELHAWLDALRHPPGRPPGQEDPAGLALALGRLGDRRAIPDLVRLALDGAASTEERREALGLIGELGQLDAVASIHRLVEGPDAQLAREAAVALGRLGDPRVRAALREALEAQPDAPEVALALGRLGDTSAVPGLQRLVADDDGNEDLRRKAIRRLGHLGDPRAVPVLLSVLEDFRLRRHAAVALGRLGDDRARGPLETRLARERNTRVREDLVMALGLLGDAGSIPLLVRVAAQDGGRAAENAAESLVRMDAIGGAIGGIDVGPGVRRVWPTRECGSRAPDHPWHYRHRTWCETATTTTTLRPEWPAVPGTGGWIALLRVRRSDADGSTRLRVEADESHETLQVDGAWSQHVLRWGAPPDRVHLETSPGVRLHVDHLLVLPAAMPPASGT